MAEGVEVTVSEAAARTGYTTRHITRLLRQGLVPGRKVGPIWLLTVEAVTEYKRTAPRPGRKSRPQSRY